MSAFVDRDYSSTQTGEAPAMATHRRAAARTASAAEYAPTTSIYKVFITIATCLLLSLLIGARGVVHAGTGMPDGPVRATTLAVGNAALGLASAAHLTWPWDQIQAALGRAPQPQVSPLLASGVAGTSTPTPRPATPTQAPRPTPPSRPALGGAVSHPSATSSPTAQPTATATRAVASAPTSGAATVAPAPSATTRQPAPSVTPRTAPPVSRGAGSDGVTPGQATHAVPTASASRRPAGRHGTPPRHPAAPPRHVAPRPARGHGETNTSSPGLPLRAITPTHPLRLLVTGDSLPGYLGPQLVDLASAAGSIDGHVDVHDGTGLTRPDFVDWSLVARQQVAAYNPDAVVVWIGGNDFQNMTLPNGAFFQAGTPAWTREYQRRVEICMRIWAQGGTRRVYWLSMPPARNPDWAHDYAQINVAVQAAAAQVPGAEYLNILGPITDHGRYSDYVTQNGQPVLVRESDGVHVNIAGSEIVAHEVLPVLVRDWRLGAQTTPPAHQGAPARLPTVFVNAVDAPQSPASVFHAEGRLLYCWARNDALPAGTASVTFRWVKERPLRVVDDFAVTRGSGAYTGAYDDAVDKDLGPYSCTVLAGPRTIGVAHFTVVR